MPFTTSLWLSFLALLCVSEERGAVRAYLPLLPLKPASSRMDGRVCSTQTGAL